MAHLAERGILSVILRIHYQTPVPDPGSGPRIRAPDPGPGAHFPMICAVGHPIPGPGCADVINRSMLWSLEPLAHSIGQMVPLNP